MVKTRRAGGSRAVTDLLISFDIDGTLEVGDPPGLIPLDAVRRAIAHGFVVGSCSDRPLHSQQELWERHAVPVHFSVLKQHLDSVRATFEANQYLHIGDSPVDRWAAAGAGFGFIHIERTDLEDSAGPRGHRYLVETREQAVREVFEQASRHSTQWSAIVAIASQVGTTPETLRSWVRHAEVVAGLAELREMGLLD